jgi:hypothetical protein
MKKKLKIKDTFLLTQGKNKTPLKISQIFSIIKSKEFKHFQTFQRLILK